MGQGVFSQSLRYNLFKTIYLCERRVALMAQAVIVMVECGGMVRFPVERRCKYIAGMVSKCYTLVEIPVPPTYLLFELPSCEGCKKQYLEFMNLFENFIPPKIMNPGSEYCI